MAILQGINVILFTFEAVYYIVPSIWIVLGFVLWEGLLGGGAYVNTFYRISEEVPPARKQFALSASAIADSTGIAIAGEFFVCLILIATTNSLNFDYRFLIDARS